MSGYKIHDQFAPHFITMTIVGWVDVFSRKECKDIIIESMLYCIMNKGLIVHSYVIMESHVHLIISAKEESKGLSSIIRDFKKYTSKEIVQWVKKGKESRKEWILAIFKTHARKLKKVKKYQVWQHNNQAKICVHPKFTMQKINYIHNNPVTAGIVGEPEYYVYSSAANYAGKQFVKMDVSKLQYGSLEGYIYT